MKNFYIIGIRYNPQLGAFLKVKIATAKLNKKSITAKFEDLGEMTSLHFEKYSFTGVHLCTSPSECFDDYQWSGYFDKSKAIAELQKWLDVDGISKERAKDGIKLIENS